MKGSRADAKACALKLLSYRSRSKKELLEKLRVKGFNSGQIAAAIQSLENAGLINDKTLAAELFRYSVERKSLGKSGIRIFLARRGIDEALINSTLASHTKEAEEEAARSFVEKKLRTLQNYPENVVKRRLWGMLQRRGVSTEVIKKTVNSLPIG